MLKDAIAFFANQLLAFVLTGKLVLDAMAASIGGPVTKLLFDDVHYQLKLFETGKCSRAVH